jgi:hypothetical protein
VVLAWPPYRELILAALGSRPFSEHILSLPRAVAWLLGQLLWPVNLNADPALAGVTEATPGAVFGLGALLATAVSALVLLRSRPAVAFGVLWSLLWLAVVLLLPRPDLVNDRQLYMALIGLGWLTAAALLRLLHWRSAAGGLFVAGAAGLVVALGVLTVLRGQVYRDEVSFWNDVLAGAPRNARAYNNLGLALTVACDTAGAAAAFSAALAVDPGYVRARVNARLLAAGTLPGAGTDCASRGALR